MPFVILIKKSVQSTNPYSNLFYIRSFICARGLHWPKLLDSKTELWKPTLTLHAFLFFLNRDPIPRIIRPDTKCERAKKTVIERNHLQPAAAAGALSINKQLWSKRTAIQ